MNQCPQCDYILDGLPSAHACPECGFEYDEDARWFKLKSMPIRGRQKSLPYYLAATTIFVAILIFYPDAAKLAFLVFVPCSILWDIVLWLRSDDGPGILVLTREGVDVYDKWRKRTSLHWAEVDSVSYTTWIGNVVLRGDDRRKLLSIYKDSLGGQSQALECVDEINLRLSDARRRAWSTVQ